MTAPDYREAREAVLYSDMDGEQLDQAIRVAVRRTCEAGRAYVAERDRLAALTDPQVLPADALDDGLRGLLLDETLEQHYAEIARILRQSSLPASPELVAHYEAAARGANPAHRTDPEPAPARAPIPRPKAPVVKARVVELLESREIRYLGFERIPVAPGRYPVSSNSEHGVCIDVAISDYETAGMWVARDRVRVLEAAK